MAVHFCACSLSLIFAEIYYFPVALGRHLTEIASVLQKKLHFVGALVAVW